MAGSTLPEQLVQKAHNKKTLRQFNLKLLFCCSLFLLNTGCTMLKHGDDPNYTYCKTLENKILFSSNSTLFSTNPSSTYSQTAATENEEEKQRAQDAYDKLNCSRYQALNF